MTPLTQKDLHVHTEYCNHRYTDDRMEAYLQGAERSGMAEISFTEHAAFAAPMELTQYTVYPTLTDEEALAYFPAMDKLRRAYHGPLKINIGLEIDYLEGFEEQTAASLDKYGALIEDGLIAVHNVRIGDRFYNVCVEDRYPAALEAAGGELQLAEHYYRTLIRSVTADLGPHKPKRVAHPTQVFICKRQFPGLGVLPDLAEEFVRTVKEHGYALELNTSGLHYPLCGEIYGMALLPLILRYDVPVALGSDSHRADTIGRDFTHPDILTHLQRLRPVRD